MDSPIKHRIAPSVPVTFTVTADDGTSSTRSFRLSFDFNVLARIEEKTGLRMLGYDVWRNLSAKTVGVMFWAAALPHHPEYEGDEGHEALCSYLDFAAGEKVTDALWEAFLLYLPKDRADILRAARSEKEKELPNAQTPATPADPNLTGSNLPQSPDTTSASRSASSAS
jgi:hypothetical protein